MGGKREMSVGCTSAEKCYTVITARHPILDAEDDALHWREIQALKTLLHVGGKQADGSQDPMEEDLDPADIEYIEARKERILAIYQGGWSKREELRRRTYTEYNKKDIKTPNPKANYADMPEEPWFSGGNDNITVIDDNPLTIASYTTEDTHAWKAGTG